MPDKNSLKKKDFLILLLLCIGFLFFAAVQQFGLDQQIRQERYLEDQTYVDTCDLKYVLPYKNLYIGNFPNTSALFSRLPQVGSIDTFRLYPDELTVRINYSTSSTGKGDAEKTLLYNSAAAFALLNNLEGILYHFTDITYQVTREDAEQCFGPVKDYLDSQAWQEKIKKPLTDPGLVSSFASVMLKEVPVPLSD